MSCRLVSCAALLAAIGCGPVPHAYDANAAAKAPVWVSVGSREYKVVLDAERFAGDPGAAAESLWDDLAGEVRDRLDRDTKGHLDDLDKERLVRFYDTPGTCRLKGIGFVLREREQEGEREVTVKFRSVDRYLAMARDLTSDVEGAESKFEEDISPPFTGRFSSSTTVPIGPDHTLATLRDPVALVPGLGDRLDGHLGDALAVVGGVTFREEVWGKGEIDLGKLEAEVSVTLWYAGSDDEPVLAEASFKVEQPDEEYPEDDMSRALGAFRILQDLEGWIDPESPTKTSFAYDVDPSFCD